MNFPLESSPSTIPGFSNSTGLLDMGVATRYLPGHVKHDEQAQIDKIARSWNAELKEIFKPTDLKSRLANEEIKAVLIFGEDPLADSENERLFNGVEFMLVTDLFQTETTGKADVVLPMASYVEQDGTFTACDLRVQKANKIFRPKSGKANWEFIAEIGSRFDDGFEYETSDDIYTEIMSVNRFYADTEPGEFWGKNLYSNGFSSEEKYADYEVDVSTQSPEKPMLLSSESFYKVKVKV